MPGDPRFKKVLDEMWDVHQKKSHDYGKDEDPLQNIRAAEEFGVPNWVGTAIRLNDKVQRLKAFAKKGVLKNESIEDAFIDVANYAVLALLMYREGSVPTVVLRCLLCNEPDKGNSLKLDPSRNALI